MERKRANGQGCTVMMRNFTLKLDERLLNRVRHLAVDEDRSVSAWVTDLIERAVKERDSYEECRQRALKMLEQGARLGRKPLAREEVYER